MSFRIFGQQLKLASTHYSALRVYRPAKNLADRYRAQFEVLAKRTSHNGASLDFEFKPSTERKISPNSQKASVTLLSGVDDKNFQAGKIKKSLVAPTSLVASGAIAMKEDTSLFMLADDSSEKISGAIIPFSDQNFFQELFFFYQYPMMHYMDLLLNYMPWWAAIVGTTATIRLLTFPLVLKMNIIGIKVSNLMPETQQLQVKINEAMVKGDEYGAALNKAKLKALYKENKISILQRLWPTLIQTPMYVCLFFTLKNLAIHYKLESLSTGGALWFANLMNPDPLYILPLVTCTSMFLLLNYGIEGSSGPIKQMGPIARWVMRAMPVGLFAIVYSFPAAVLLFWTTNNLFTLSYALILRIPWIKRLFSIPMRIDHPPSALPMMNQTFKGQIKNAYDAGKVKRTTMDIRRLDDIAFRKAGVEPLRKTYKTPPTGTSSS